MRAVIGISCVLVLTLVLASAVDARHDGQVDRQAASDTHWTSGVRRVTLDNGLTVLMLQRGTLPIVSVEALYKVGSRNERPGITGAAHYIEHMAFRRTERINKTDLTNQVLRWGGRWGGYTSYDQTVYNAHAPTAYLDWLIFMERQRLRHVLFDAESVELERTSVISELRQYENSPAYTMAEHRLRRAAMVAHPYGSPIMGWISDLQAVTPADLERFYRDYYAANNLVLAIVGRFDEAEALALVHKHFDDAPADGRSTRLRTSEPEQTGAAGSCTVRPARPPTSSSWCMRRQPAIRAIPRCWCWTPCWRAARPRAGPRHARVAGCTARWSPPDSLRVCPRKWSSRSIRGSTRSA